MLLHARVWHDAARNFDKQCDEIRDERGDDLGGALTAGIGYMLCAFADQIAEEWTKAAAATAPSDQSSPSPTPDVPPPAQEKVWGAMAQDADARPGFEHGFGYPDQD